jgi:hypothetical protein
LLRILELGRKRILDTALTSTLEEAGIKRLATLDEYGEARPLDLSGSLRNSVL